MMSPVRSPSFLSREIIARELPECGSVILVTTAYHMRRALLLAPMEAILSTATHFVLKKYKEHGIAMESEQTDERMLVTP